MRFIESVTGEIFNLVKDFVSGLFPNHIFLTAADKVFALTLQNLRNFFSHGLAQEVGLSQGKVS